MGPASRLGVTLPWTVPARLLSYRRVLIVGVHLVLVTGRRYPAARRVADHIGGRLDLVLHNGALIFENGEVLRRRPLPRETAGRAVRLGRERRADPVVHCGPGGEGRLVVEGLAD